jgi:hypothetical protein
MEFTRTRGFNLDLILVAAQFLDWYTIRPLWVSFIAIISFISKNQKSDKVMKSMGSLVCQRFTKVIGQWLITRRSQVQILTPLPNKIKQNQGIARK